MFFNKKKPKKHLKIRSILGKDEGAVTVEASFIIPIILILVMGVLFISLFYIDMAVIKSEMMKTADHVAASWKVNGYIKDASYDRESLINRSMAYLMNPGGNEVSAKGQEELSSRLTGRLLVTRPETISVDISLYRVRVTVKARFAWPLSTIGKYFGGKGLTFHGETKILVDNREELLRITGGE